MYRLVIVAQGDNESLHRKALEAAVEVVQEINHTPVYRAYLERTTPESIETIPTRVV